MTEVCPSPGPIVIRKDVYDHLSRLHQQAAQMMVERGDLKITSEDDND